MVRRFSAASSGRVAPAICVIILTMPKKQWVQKTSMIYWVQDPKVRFLKKLRRDSGSGCWVWTASTRAAGSGFRYGQFSYLGYPEWAHRVAWMLWRGEIPVRLQVCHSCDNTLCVNPNHLFLGTQQDNIDDMMKKGRDACVGERNRSARLTVKAVHLIRDWHASGRSFRSIAKALGVHRQTIADVVQGRSWRHV